MERPKLGEWRNLEKEVYKRHYRVPKEGRRTEWTQRDIRTVRGLYIGWRTVYNGYSEWLGDEEGYNFSQSDHREVWLFIIDDRKNPIRVFPEDVKS